MVTTPIRNIIIVNKKIKHLVVILYENYYSYDRKLVIGFSSSSSSIQELSIFHYSKVHSSFI